MPLLDHFHPPTSQRRSWTGFHGLWAAVLVERLNAALNSDELHADMHVHVGGAIEVEVDVAALEEPGPGGATLAVAPAYTPVAAKLVAPAVFPDDIEVRVFSTAAGPTLVGAIELVSPANKDRPETRRAFAAKCAAYLATGIGVVVVDIVTSRLSNLHDEVVGELGLGPEYRFDPTPATYAVAYRPVRRPDGDRIEMWPEPLAVGGNLPTLPLGLRNIGTVPVDLDASYSAACIRSGLRRQAG